MQSTPLTAQLKIGTRGSPLALAQARQVRAAIARLHDIPEDEILIDTISTAGDRSQGSNRSLSDIGGKGLFSKEIEERLLSGDIDLAVHSAKDMATRLPDGLEMEVFLPREDVRDAFICLVAENLDGLPEGAIFGSSSLRRRAQLLRVRPDLEVVEFRGNLGTRLAKLEQGIAAATLLAAAGLNRLGQTHRAQGFLDPEIFPPAPAQGAIGLETRVGDERTMAYISGLNDEMTKRAVQAERAMLAVLDGSCRTPIGVYTRHEDDQFRMTGQVLSPDGAQAFQAELAGSQQDAAALGHALGKDLVGQAGESFMDALRAAQ